MFCKICGQQLRDGSSFCVNCGASLAPATVPPESTAARQPAWTPGAPLPPPALTDAKEVKSKEASKHEEKLDGNNPDLRRLWGTTALNVTAASQVIHKLIQNTDDCKSSFFSMSYNGNHLLCINSGNCFSNQNISAITKRIILMTAVCLFFSCSGNNERRQGGSSVDSTITVLQPEVKPVVNIYIENSGSMDGYVKGVTEFEQAVYNYLSDIKISGAADSLNLHYINSEVISQGTVSEEMNILRDFIEKLEPNTFKMKGGNRETSDIADVIKSVLHNTEEHTVSVLVTDGIFSPGKDKDAGQYLVNQQIGIKNSVSVFLGKEKDAAVIVYQLSSRFDGIYYNKDDKPIRLTTQRPFYIWIIGNAKHLTALRRAVPESKFNGNGVQHIFSITAGDKNVKYFINPSIGKFQKSRTNTNTNIEKLKKDSRTGNVEFAINVDFSGLLLDEAYLLNSDNYENSSKYDLEIKSSVTKGKGYTHTLHFSSDKVYKGAVVVKLKAVRPGWIEEVNDDDGSTAVPGKTYGIKYQIDGVFDAFTFDNKYYTEVKININ